MAEALLHSTGQNIIPTHLDSSQANSSDASQPSSKGDAKSGGGPVLGQGGGTGGTSWSALGDAEMEQLVQSKGWGSPVDALKSYRELERSHSQARQALAEYERMLAALDPYWDDIAQVVQAKRQGAALSGSGNTGGSQEQVQQLQALLRQHLEPLNQRIGQVLERSQVMARDMALREFFREHPDAKALEEDMAVLFQSGAMTVADPTNPTSYLSSLEAAYRAVKASRAEREEASRKASGVAGGSGGHRRPSGLDVWDSSKSLDDIRRQLAGENA
jgi:hypothetical protein